MLSIFSLSAQTGSKKKAERYFRNYFYTKAIAEYESVKNKRTPENRNLAESYYRIGDYENSEVYFEAVVRASDYTKYDVYNYASVLKMNEKYALAEEWMLKFHKLAPKDSRGREYADNLGYYKSFNNEEQFTVQGLDMNTEQSDFGASYFMNQIVFASTRGGTSAMKKRWNWNNLGYLDLYVADTDAGKDLINIKPFDTKLNKRYHEGPATFSGDGNLMVYTVNNYYEKDANGFVRLELFSMEFEDGKWKNKRELDFNDRDYSTGHGSLTADGKTLYFTSDMPGGYGGTDIYKTQRRHDGSWSKPRNLGSKINSEGNESFPFIHRSKKLLFFSSDGKLGLGGADIFVAQLIGDKVGEVENLRAPINSNRDDIAFILDQDEKSGYFSSNRLQGGADDDIYSFEMLKPFEFQIPICTNMSITNLLVTDRETEEPLDSVEVIIVNNCNKEEILNALTLTDGMVKDSVDCMQIRPDCDYSIQLRKEGYLNKELNCNIKATSLKEAILTPDVDLSLKKIHIAEDLGEVVGLNPIYFDFNKATLRPESKLELDKIARTLIDNPELRIEIGAHTDRVGSSAFNFELSHARAASSASYILSHGIDKARITSRGYGESIPVVVDEKVLEEYPYLMLGQSLTEQYINSFRGDKAKMEALDQLNRRVEFIVF